MSGGLSTGGCLTDAANTSANLDWYGTLRGRVGWANGPVLVYAAPPDWPTPRQGRFEQHLQRAWLVDERASIVDQDRLGYWRRCPPNIYRNRTFSLNLGYQYVDLGSLSLTSTTTGGGGTFATQTASTRAAFHVATLGLSWRFSPTGMAPWQGLYAGGHAGGAWGENTNANYTSGFIVSDARLKRDIILVGRLDDCGLGLYQVSLTWWSDTVYVGVMAQEVALDPSRGRRSGWFG